MSVADVCGVENGNAMDSLVVVEGRTNKSIRLVMKSNETMVFIIRNNAGYSELRIVKVDRAQLRGCLLGERVFPLLLRSSFSFNYRKLPLSWFWTK